MKTAITTAMMTMMTITKMTTPHNDLANNGEDIVDDENDDVSDNDEVTA